MKTMALTNTETRWGAVARAFHWGMAALIVAMLLGGTIMVAWPNAELATKFQLYQWHKSFGLVLFALLLLRLVWRLGQPTPALPATSSAFTRRAAALSHGLLYLLMAALPVTGYLMSSANTLGVPTVLFGIWEVPHVLAADARLEAIFKQAHDLLGTALLIVVAVHVLAAVKHAVINRDGIWARMVYGASRV